MTTEGSFYLITFASIIIIMRKITLPVLFVMIISSLSAQEGPALMFGLNTEVAFPVTSRFRDGYHHTGYGGGIRFQYGSSFLRGGSLSASYLSFTAKGSGTRVNGQVGILPVLLGIRHNLAGNWYVEPQGGYAWYFFSNTANGVNTRRTESAVSFALATGIVSKDFDFSIRYQDALVAANNQYGNISIRVGYLLSKRKAK